SLMNVAVGCAAGAVLTAGEANVLIGGSAGSSFDSGNGNTLIGWHVAETFETGEFNIVICYDVDVPAASTRNYLNIGDAITGDLSSGDVTVSGDLSAANLSGTNTGDQSDATLTFSDITTNNVSSTKHGFAPKSPADATKFLNGATTPDYALVKDGDLSTSDI